MTIPATKLTKEIKQFTIDKNLSIKQEMSETTAVTGVNLYKPPVMGETRKKPIYICKGCNIIFHTRRGLLNHNEETCMLIHISRKKKVKMMDDWSDSSPPVNELYQLCKLLTDKVLKLEAKIEEMEKGTIGKSTTLPVSTAATLKWLNTSYIPSKSYIDWLSEIKITRKNLETVYDYTLTDGIIEILSQYAIMPIKMFPRKKKIYVFSHDGTREFPSWNDNMTEEEFHKFIEILCNRFMKEFIVWQKENERMILEEDSWKDKYILYTKKIMRTQCMTDKICKEVKKWITARDPPPQNKKITDDECDDS